MKRLNNKGMTIVEILVCFMIVGFISTALFSTASMFSTKRNIESVRATLLQYRNQVDKIIEDDLINRSVTNAEVSHSGSTYTVNLMFKDGGSKTLTIFSYISGEYGTTSCSGTDSFYVKYGNDKFTLPEGGISKKGSCRYNDLRFGTIKVSNDENVLYIYINLTHPDIGNIYAIDIVAPINYAS